MSFEERESRLRDALGDLSGNRRFDSGSDARGRWSSVELVGPRTDPAVALVVRIAEHGDTRIYVRIDRAERPVRAPAAPSGDSASFALLRAAIASLIAGRSVIAERWGEADDHVDIVEAGSILRGPQRIIRWAGGPPETHAPRRTGWPTPVRVGLTGLLLLGAWIALRLAAGAPAGTPAAAADPLNPAVRLDGGVFVRGSADHDPDVDPRSPYSTLDESVRRMEIAGFWMQQHEVTNAEYRRFDPGHAFEAGREQHPVVDVTWEEAMAYAAWLDGTLPTESQWEYAARGTDSRIYPWGDAAPTCQHAHFADCEPRSTIAVLSRPDGATPEGIHDLAGNVWEWVVPDWYDPQRFPVNQASRRMRGGSFVDAPFFLRASNRNNEFYAGFRYRTVGFRVVWPAEG